MEMHIVHGVYYLSSGPHTLHFPLHRFFMQIDLEMTFITWGFHMEAYRSTRADKNKTKQKKKPTKPTTAQFMCSEEK